MQRLSVIVVLAAGLAAGSAHAMADGFEFSADAFRQSLAARLKQDGREAMSGCRPISSTEIDCRFRGDPNAGARGLLAHIDHSEHMALTIDGKKLMQITLNGQRNTPAAQQHFIGIVTSAVGALTPGLDKAKVDAIVGELGLTRGDDAPNIGEGMGHREPGWRIDCLNQFSQVATDIACTIVPGGA